MPGLGRRDPSFPYLPGESRDVSRSIGGVLHGHLIESDIVPQPHPELAFLDVQYERRLIYTSDRMLEILEGAAEHLRTHFSDTVVYLGNQSAPGGGDIPYSFSHNSGRDADVAFFVRGPDGEPAVPPDLISLDDEGRYEGEHGTFQFDVARNWRFVEGLVEVAGDQLQYVFISRPLRRMLLEHAREVEAPASIRRRARQVLHQPRGALPHDDHYHVRIYCSETDVASGCRDRGREWAWYEPHREADRRAVRRAIDALASETISIREAAARRLALLNARRAVPRLIEQLDDPAPRVRAASARALTDLERGTPALADRLADERHPRVYAEIVQALGRLGGERAARALIDQLDRTLRLQPAVGLEIDVRTIVAESLIRTESARAVEPLIERLEGERPDVRAAVARALRYLTNHDFGVDWRHDDAGVRSNGLEVWRDWYRRHHEFDRDRWLVEGFERAGFEIDALRADEAWSLCRAVGSRVSLSYNAQRVLMEISGHRPASLTWPTHDAHFYWRRWFERRYERFGLSPIPPSMSTLDDE